MTSLNMEFKDYYKTLNISNSATDEEIKKAYKQLAKKHHPDSDGGSEEKFKEIQEAYEVLKDKIKRDKYDSMYRNQNSFNKNTYQNQSSSYSYSAGHSNTGNSSSNSNTQNNTNTNQQQSYQQKQYNDVKFKNPQKQAHTQNAGNKQQSKTNNQNESFSDFFQMFFGEKEKSARGTDYEMNIELDLEDAFNGTTRKLEISSTGQGQRRLEVLIPAGVREGNRIKVTGEGKIGKNGGENGDLYLKVKIKEHPLFKIDGDDIHSTLELEPYEAILGADKEVLTLGSKVEIVIPPQTNHGKILRLRGRGLPNAKTKTYGDHFVHTAIKIKDHYTFEELQHYKAIKKINQE